jgi:hypothetical protein
VYRTRRSVGVDNKLLKTRATRKRFETTVRTRDFSTARDHGDRLYISRLYLNLIFLVWNYQCRTRTSWVTDVEKWWSPFFRCCTDNSRRVTNCCWLSVDWSITCYSIIAASTLWTAVNRNPLQLKYKFNSLWNLIKNKRFLFLSQTYENILKKKYIYIRVYVIVKGNHYERKEWHFLTLFPKGKLFSRAWPRIAVAASNTITVVTLRRGRICMLRVCGAYTVLRCRAQWKCFECTTRQSPSCRRNNVDKRNVL